MKIGGAALVVAVGLLLLYAASKGGLDCLGQAWVCLKTKAGGP